MIWIIITAVLTASTSIYFGHKRLFYLYQIQSRNLLFFFMICLASYSVLLALFKIGIMSEAVGGAIITNVYASIFGFFLGAAVHQFRNRTSAGKVLYAYRSFWSEQAPVLVAVALMLFGFYRTDIFSGDVLTPIRLTSGLSFLAIGIWGMTLRLVPEFRSKGIVLLDIHIEWEDFVNYQWYLEEVIEVEYELENAIKSFKTYIPPEDQLTIEDVLRAKMNKKLEEKSTKNQE